jgi:hypothetical protein
MEQLRQQKEGASTTIPIAQQQQQQKTQIQKVRTGRTAYQVFKS